jgi:hypothetical protein
MYPLLLSPLLLSLVQIWREQPRVPLFIHSPCLLVSWSSKSKLPNMPHSVSSNPRRWRPGQLPLSIISGCLEISTSSTSQSLDWMLATWWIIYSLRSRVDSSTACVVGEIQNCVKQWAGSSVFTECPVHTNLKQIANYGRDLSNDYQQICWCIPGQCSNLARSLAQCNCLYLLPTRYS